MRLLIKILGLAFLLVSIYFLGQNIIFTTQTSPYWWRDISAASSVLAVAGGVAMVMFSRQTRSAGWAVLCLGILLVFVSGGVILKPTSLWTLFLALVSFVAGLQLITTGRLSL
ncbi:MAG: hypothetical protein F6K04_25850 [Leptolyngbya sp. SIO4C5]|uniref:hypothetical protein n=1 Tax=Sphaerothrix gracilis TaxID=3151835 RepID=UPI0013C1425A|nr:hypothetical protein [Leptolyngbya sp. SIO4C5]